MTLNTGDLGPDYGGPLLYQAHNAYETRTSQACSNSVVGCCTSSSLTRLVQDTSTTYNCWSPQSLPNDMLLQVKTFTILNTPLKCLQLLFQAVPCAFNRGHASEFVVHFQTKCLTAGTHHQQIEKEGSNSASQRCAWAGQHLTGWQQQSGRSITEPAALVTYQHACRKHHSLFRDCQTHVPI